MARLIAVIALVVFACGRAHAQNPWTNFTTWGNSSLSALYVPLQPPAPPSGMDMNGDGLADLANATSTGTNFVASSYWLPSAATSGGGCLTGDFDGSGRFSLACVSQLTSSSSPNTIEYAPSLGTQSGTIQTQSFTTHLGASDYTYGGMALDCKIMDVNGDNRDDIICAIFNSGNTTANFPYKFFVYLATGDLSGGNAFTFQVWPSSAPQIGATATFCKVWPGCI